jgi:hypothetical protein
MTIHQILEYSKPSGASGKASNTLLKLAAKYRDELWRYMAKIDAPGAPVLQLDRKQAGALAVAVTELAEDLHADGGLWRCLETYHVEFFGVPLPLLCRPGDTPLATFDSRRFQFFFYSLWRHFQPDDIISPCHRGLVALADHASAYFSAAFAKLPRRSPARTFLASSNKLGWEVKRKLVWLGTRSFLFRFAHEDYLEKQEFKKDEEINATDHFLLQKCTAWSGLGVVDVLAGLLDLTEEERAELRGWHEPHSAVYRIERLETKGPVVEVLEALNLVNDRPYRIRSEENLLTNPFKASTTVSGSLVPWRGEWYWSGLQRLLKATPDGVAVMRKGFRESGNFAFCYCPDLEQRAREIIAAQYTDFTAFYGGDLAVFPDQQAVQESERKRLLPLSEAKTEIKPRESAPLHVGDHHSPNNNVALFFQEGEGAEAFIRYAPLLSGLKKQDGVLSEDEAHAIQAFIEEPNVSPALVRRLIRETGSAAIERFYHLPEDSNGIDYLLRRFKGQFYRKRYPCISLRNGPD